MRIILAPTDFSKTARNAINYAAEIAKQTLSKLILLHAYHPPIVIAEGPVMLPLPADLEKNCMKQLKRIRYDLITKHGRKLDIELTCLNGLAVDVIEKYSNDNNVDLIVMGTQGVGYLEEKLLGSVTSELIKSSEIPVLSVASKVKFKNIKNIVLATDYEKLSSKVSLEPVKDLARLFKSHIYILNISQKESAIPSVYKALHGLQLEHLLEGQDHSFHFATNKDVVKGINGFVQARRMDMIVMLPRHRRFMQNIFQKRVSKAMLFHTETPLMTIHT